MNAISSTTSSPIIIQAVTIPPTTEDITATPPLVHSTAISLATTVTPNLTMELTTERSGTSEIEIPGLSTDGKEAATQSSVLSSISTLLIVTTVIASLALAIVIMTVMVLVVRKLVQWHKSVLVSSMG